MKKRITIILVTGMAMAAGLYNGCSNDPEGPVASVFVDDSVYTPGAGETVRFVEQMDDVSIIPVDVGIGEASIVRLGGIVGIRFETLLMDFDFDSLVLYTDKTVDSVLIDFPVTSVSELFHLGVTFHELTEDFSEDSLITGTPPFLPDVIPGASGETVRDMSSTSTEFTIDPSIVQGWIDGNSYPWPYGIVVRWPDEPDTMGLIEMTSQNYGSDPPVMRVIFSDDSEAIFPVNKDYNIVSYDGAETACVGGVARRLFFEFDLSTVDRNAMIHYSALVLHTDGEKSIGTTPGEDILGFSDDFIYYLYTPDSGDISDPGFLEGTGVSINSFTPTLSSEIKIPLGTGFVRDILDGKRVNNGLVLQSDLEKVRFQKATFFDIASGDSLRPYIEIIYSLPADFSGE